jgi:predicted thioredoxin/glutaredoxin
MTQKGTLVRQVKGVARIGRVGLTIHPVLINQYDTGVTEVAWFLCQCTDTRNDRAFHHNQHWIGQEEKDNHSIYHCDTKSQG